MVTLTINTPKPKLSRPSIENEISRIEYMLKYGKFTPEDKVWTTNYLKELKQQLYALPATKKELKQAR